MSLFYLDITMSEEAVLGRRYTLVIPKSIRRRLSLREGQRVLIRVEEGKIVIEPLPLDPYKVLGEIVGEPYDEGRDEEKAERWLRDRAGG